jgi:hypothetical protein
MLSNAQIQALRKKYNLDVSEQSGSVMPSTNLSSDERIKMLESGTYGSQGLNKQDSVVKPEVSSVYGKSFFNNIVKASNSFLQTGADILVNPVARTLLRPAVELTKVVQSLIPGGKTGNETVKTPFGDITPRKLGSSQGLAQSGFDTLDTALSFLPVEKLFTGGVKLLSKGGTKLLKTGGEILTGVEKSKIGQWIDLAKNNPEKVSSLKSMIESHPQEPFLGLANKIAERFTSLKQTAQEAWATASDTFKNSFPDTTFNLSYKVPELKTPLEQFGLSLKQVRDSVGKLTSDFKIVAKNKLNPFNAQETSNLQGLVDVLKNARDYTVDYLLAVRSKFDSAYNAVKYSVDGKPTKYHAAVMALKESAEQFINEVLPSELKQANKLYADYHDAFMKVGSKILDSSGQVKQGAETFLNNIKNVNKGVDRQKVIDAGKKLGIDILDEANNLDTAKQLMATVPNSTKNRTVDIIRGIIGSNAFGAGAGAGAIFNPAIGVPALLINIMSSPNMYRGLIEAIAGTSKKLPITKIIESLSESEKILLRRVIYGTPKEILNQSNNRE